MFEAASQRSWVSQSRRLCRWGDPVWGRGFPPAEPAAFGGGATGAIAAADVVNHRYARELRADGSPSSMQLRGRQVSSRQVPGKTPGAGLRFTLPRHAAHTASRKQAGGRLRAWAPGTFRRCGPWRKRPAGPAGLSRGRRADDADVKSLPTCDVPDLFVVLRPAIAFLLISRPCLLATGTLRAK